VSHAGLIQTGDFRIQWTSREDEAAGASCVAQTKNVPARQVEPGQIAWEKCLAAGSEVEHAIHRRNEYGEQKDDEADPERDPAELIDGVECFHCLAPPYFSKAVVQPSAHNRRTKLQIN
jgi:hypothetical protein